MAVVAQALHVRVVVGPALTERHDVITLSRKAHAPMLLALDAKRVG